jgi:hypothetical protein
LKPKKDLEIFWGNFLINTELATRRWILGDVDGEEENTSINVEESRLV